MKKPSKTPATWCLINDLPKSAAENMAIDEALLCSFDPETSLPLLRIYGWQPAALSIGRYQSVKEVNLEYCQRNGIELVRRISGGGAVFHADELTYTLICTAEQAALAGSIKESFRQLTSFLMEFYRSLGFAPCYAVDTAAAVQTAHAPFCYAANEDYDILINDYKIGGNAQRRLRRKIFQHGSIPLADHLQKGTAVMSCRVHTKAIKATCLHNLGVKMGREKLISLLVAAFTYKTGCNLHKRQLTSKEQVMAEQLATEKYRHNRWTLAGEEP